MILKAIDRILWLTYGNHGSSKENREKAEIVLKTLSSSGAVPRSELMRQIGLDEDVESDVDSFNDLVRPLKGKKSSNPLQVCFLLSSKEDGDVYYRLSRGAFSASFLKMKSDILYFLDRETAPSGDENKIMDQVLWLAYANHSNTYQHRQKAREVLKCLIEGGKHDKRHLMIAAGLEYGDENDDQRFRGMMKYLRASWQDEEDALNPVHTSSHGFLVHQEMQRKTAYYKISTREFKSSMNVVSANIRQFMS